MFDSFIKKRHDIGSSWIEKLINLENQVLTKIYIYLEKDLDEIVFR